LNKFLRPRAWIWAGLLLGNLAVIRAADPVRTLPPPGIEIAAEDRERLQGQVALLEKRLEAARSAIVAPENRQFLPDVEIFVKAVDYALRDGGFYHAREVAFAHDQLQLAAQRLDALHSGQHPWTRAQGLVVRGFRSNLDGSPQPYGLVIPQDLDFARPAPLYVWLHGRGDTTLDLQFIQQRMTSPGQVQPAGAIVLHPFGRYCNGYKSAGEADVFEAIEAVCREYAIDHERIVLCGFSMGGAGVWHLGAHYPDQWAAMSPGAGFVDVRRYQNIPPEKFPAWYEQALWNVYDVPSYVRNLLNVPLVAYSGELDKQKQAADIMEDLLRQEGLTMTHIVGRGVAHKYEPSALADVLARLHAFEQQGINHFPETIHFQTRTLRYHHCHWIDVLGLGEHWRDARVDARRMGAERVEIATENVTHLRMTCPWPSLPQAPVTLAIDGNDVLLPPTRWTEGVALQRTPAGWQIDKENDVAPSVIRKTPGLQGPIDDAFVEPFLIVRPTGTAAHPAVTAWVAAEQARFRERWRTLFRGEPRAIDDRDVTDEHMEIFHLLLWGDAASNQVLARVAKELPIAWNEEKIAAADKSWPAAGHVLTMIAPNPLTAGRGRYIVLNSGLTFREAHDRTNSLQNPKLPDWAVIDLSVAPDEQTAGRIADAGFFDENWRYQERRSITSGGTQ